jgi:hypothetical protein
LLHNLDILTDDFLVLGGRGSRLRMVESIHPRRVDARGSKSLVLTVAHMRDVHERVGRGACNGRFVEPAAVEVNLLGRDWLVRVRLFKPAKGVSPRGVYTGGCEALALVVAHMRDVHERVGRGTCDHGFVELGAVDVESPRHERLFGVRSFKLAEGGRP